MQEQMYCRVVSSMKQLEEESARLDRKQQAPGSGKRGAARHQHMQSDVHEASAAGDAVVLRPMAQGPRGAGSEWRCVAQSGRLEARFSHCEGKACSTGQPKAAKPKVRLVCVQEVLDDVLC